MISKIYVVIYNFIEAVLELSLILRNIFTTKRVRSRVRHDRREIRVVLQRKQQRVE